MLRVYLCLSDIDQRGDRVMAKVVGILGSPRRYGDTQLLLRLALRAAEHDGCQTELIWLYEEEIKPCLGCVSEDVKACRFPCIFEDYGKLILQKIREAEGIILASPIYWYNVSGPMKNLLDRLTCLENMAHIEGYSYLEGKVAAAIAVGKDTGAMMAISSMLLSLNSMGAILPAWAMAYSQAADVLKDEEALMDAVNVGLLVSGLIRRLAGQEGRIMYLYDPKLCRQLLREVREKRIK
ncbi:MAG TPA: flavodoxin family protein [Thermodesulfatator sp.]|nr:flavodoxin family protein [Thermodesulfatator sp.]